MYSSDLFVTPHRFFSTPSGQFINETSNSLFTTTSWPTEPAKPASLFVLHFSWLYIVYVCLACQIASILWRYWWKAPSNLPIVAYPTPFGRWIMAWRMFFDSETIVQHAYEKFDGKPFAIPTIDRWIVFISDSEKLKSLDRESESVLSMEQALHELASTDHLLASHQVAPESKGHKSESFRIMVGILKNKVRSNVPSMSEGLRNGVKEAIALEISDSNKVDEWHSVRLMPALLRVFTRVNLLVFFGEERAKTPEIYRRVMDFFWSCACAFPLLNITPSWLMPVFSNAAMGFGITRKRTFDLILRLTCQYTGNKEYAGERNTHGGNIVQWAAEMSRLDDVAETAKVTLGLLFASAFQIPLIAQCCIYRLCKFTDCHETLLAEADRCKDLQFSSANQEMPYFDSLLRETARLSPGPIVTSPRTVMQPYTSPEDGWHVPSGNWLAVPQIALMRDQTVWQRAEEFEPFRFVNEEEGVSYPRFTHPSYEYPFWGSIKHACPARFYVSIILKVVLSHLLHEYEFKLEDPEASPFMNLGIIRVPNPRMKLLVRKRVAAGRLGNSKSDSPCVQS